MIDNFEGKATKEHYQLMLEALLEAQKQDDVASLCHAATAARTAINCPHISLSIVVQSGTDLREYGAQWESVSLLLGKPRGYDNYYEKLLRYKPCIDMGYWFGLFDYNTRIEILNKIIASFDEQQTPNVSEQVMVTDETSKIFDASL